VSAVSWPQYREPGRALSKMAQLAAQGCSLQQ
jgi:hypothetical protein